MGPLIDSVPNEFQINSVLAVQSSALHSSFNPQPYHAFKSRLKMDSRTFSAVTVFNIDNDGKLVDRYPGCKCQVTCSYDPSGLSVRIVPGE